MVYKLIHDRIENNRRVKTFRNDRTGTETKITPIYKDQEGVQWYGFVDLHKIPYIRMAMAKHVLDLFTMGLTLKDILKWCEDEKNILRSEDPEKYEKLYALILEKERLAKYTANPIKKHLALATVYVLKEEDRVDHFDLDQIEPTLIKWSADPDAVSFFLTWHNSQITSFINRLSKISQTVSQAKKNQGFQLPTK